MDMNQSIPGLTIHEAGLCLSLLPATVYFATAAEVLSGNICSILWKILLWNWKGCTYTFLWAPRWFRPASAQQTALVGDHFREERVGHRWIIFPHSSSLLSRLPKSARSSWNIKSRFIQFGFANLLPLSAWWWCWRGCREKSKGRAAGGFCSKRETGPEYWLFAGQRH